MTDSFEQDSELDSGVSHTDSPQTGQKPPVNYEAKYNGVNKLNEALRKERDTLKAQLENIGVQSEQELSNIRKAATEAADKIKDYEARFGAVTSEKASLEAKVQKYEAELSARKLVATEFTNLRDLADKGYLKLPNEFENEETYKSYLSDMSASLKTGLQKSPTPPVGGGSRANASPLRTTEEVYKDMDKLSKRDPAYQEKFDKLFDELEQIRVGS